MTSILKEFYRGDISPAERQMARNSELSIATDAAAKAEELLEQTLPPELRPPAEKARRFGSEAQCPHGGDLLY